MKTKLLLSLALLCAYILPAQAYTITANVPAQTKVVYMAGNFNGWNTTKNPMTKVSDGLFTADIDLTNFKEENLDFKLCAGDKWDYEQTDPGDNLIFKLADYPNGLTVTINTFKAYQNPDAKVDLKIEVLVPKNVVECYIVGSFNGWAAPSANTKMKFEGTEDDGNIYSITINADPAGLELKLCAGPSWDFEQTAGNLVYLASDPLGTFTVNSFKSVFDPSKTGNITINATVPAGTSRVWIQGSFPGDSWSWDNLKEMTKNENGTFTYVTGLVMNLEYRLYNAPDWGHPEVGEADPTKDLPNRQVTYDPENPVKNITVWGWKVNVSGVNNTIADDVKITFNSNSITVDGIKNKIAIYDITGKLVESRFTNQTYTSKFLQQGVYILKVDNGVRKVMVK
ncbi:hypothetical protein MASR2M117_08920 [Paludibacter sp.]